MKLRPYLGTWPEGSDWCNRPVVRGRFLFCEGAGLRTI